MEDNQSGSIFYNKFYNVLNSISFTTKYLDFEILYHCLRYIYNEFICYFLDNTENTKKIYFPI